MENNKQLWTVREEELKELEKKRKELKGRKESKEEIKELSKKIHKLQNAINQHGKHKEQKVRTNTVAYKMFGKPLKELTKEEYAFYQSRGERRRRQALVL